jgi:subtilase family serine protease
MILTRRPARAGLVAGLGLAMTVMTGNLATSAAASTAAAGYVALNGSTLGVHASRTGTYSSARMSVEVALAPRDAAGLSTRLQALYSKGSQYHHWLAKGEFDSLYAPSAATRSAVARYLTQDGLTISKSASPFMVRAAGTSKQVSAAFRTSFSTYSGPGGERYFANSSAAQLPAALTSGVLGVIGLNNALRLRPAYDVATTSPRAQAGSAGTAQATSCQTPYPTDAQLFAYYTSGTSFPFGYGGGPACTGLTPSQVNSIYGAPAASPRTQGGGVTLALFELSAYQPSDIATWARTFYGSQYTLPALDTVLVDGGSLDPQCPSAGDSCPAAWNGYSGDVEVDLDIQRELTIAPDAAKIMVYDAPNDETGQDSLDDYTQIANDDAASTVSSSWYDGEAVETEAYVESENVIFEQMAAQGQSMVASAGDWGPMGSYLINGSTTPSLVDPAAQPWVTAAGGTSLEGYNPGSNPSPGYPAGAEQVWNADGLCQASGTEVGGNTGYFYCTAPNPAGGVGTAGGGGSSEYWGRPFYQEGPGVNNPYTTDGNGSTQCALATKGTPCREVPDVSAISDFYTPYSDYCTGTASLPNSECYTLEKTESDPGWIGVAGTSSSAPLWAAIAADRDSYTGTRTGLLNPLLYGLLSTDPGAYFHDITGAGQSITTNGLYPVTPGYDEATGIGTPKMAALITATS